MKVKVCPRCGGLDISVNVADLSTTMERGDKCNNCGFFSPDFLEIDKSALKEFRKELTRRRQR